MCNCLTFVSIPQHKGSVKGFLQILRFRSDRLELTSHEDRTSGERMRTVRKCRRGAELNSPHAERGLPASVPGRG